MPTQIEKLGAHAEHLLDGFLGLKEKWALLEPMLRDRVVVSARGERRQARGFISLRRTLALSCAVDAANLCFDNFPETPSICKVALSLQDEHLRLALRRSFSQWGPTPSETAETDKDTLAALKQMRKRQQKVRSSEFDKKYVEFTNAWAQLKDSTQLVLLKKVRDQVAAHTELHYTGSAYRPVTLESLGLKASHFEESIGSMRVVVELVQNLTRSASFSWDSLDKQLLRMARDFWIPEASK